MSNNFNFDNDGYVPTNDFKFGGVVWEVDTGEVIGIGETIGCENVGDQVPVIPAGLRYTYYATLTGANDSQIDYEIPHLKTIQLQYKEEDASHIVLSAIYSAELEAAVALRTNGTLVIYMASVYHGVELAREQIMEVDYTDVRYDLGGRSRSATITGYRVLTYTPDTVYLIDLVSARTGQSGRSTYRFARPDIRLRPGCPVAYKRERFTADEVSFYISAKEHYMDVSFNSDTLTGSTTYESYRRSFVLYDRYRKFTAVLTGAADAVADLELVGLEALQVRLNPGAPSYLSIKVAYEEGIKEEIAARPNGDIVISVSEGTGDAQEYVSVNFNEVSYNLQPKERTVTLVGYRTFGFTTGDTRTLVDVSEKRVREGGAVMWRSISPDLALQPMDSVVFQGSEYLAGEIHLNFERFSRYMDVYTYANITVEKGSESDAGFTGESVSNTFYPVESTSELGAFGTSKVSINGVENGPVETGIGFGGFATAELNPLF